MKPARASVVASIALEDSPEHFRTLGVDVIHGSGRFLSPTEFDVNGRTITAKHFVLATGSRPAIPPIAGLAYVPYLTNESVFDLREPLPRLIIIGAGPVGCEMAQALRRLGSDVLVVDMATRILPREDAGYGEVRWDADVTNQDGKSVATYDVLTLVAKQWPPA